MSCVSRWRATGTATKSEAKAWAVKEVIDRLDGKAVQTTEMQNSDGTPLLSGIQVMFVKPTDE